MTMPFNSFIVLDYLRYKTLAKAWKPSTMRPAVPRMNLQGSIESTFGVGYFQRWQGIMIADYGEEYVTKDTMHYGNIATLRESLLKTEPLYFLDHHTNLFTVIAQGPFEENCLVNVWNSSSNKYYVTVSLTMITMG
jgi:hypothetical protein